MDFSSTLENIFFEAKDIPEEFRLKEVHQLGQTTKEGFRTTKEFKQGVADIVVAFLSDFDEKRSSVSSKDVTERIAHGDAWFRPIAAETHAYMTERQWGV